MATSHWPPAGWIRAQFRPRGHDHAHDFYTVVPPSGEWSRSILLMHELPGLDTAIIPFAERLAERFRVVLPSIVGDDGDPTLSSTFRQMCVRREVHIFARDGASTSVGWLREFADEHVAAGDEPYGVVGLCFSGNFALALAVDPRVHAAVVAEPASGLLPSWLGLNEEDRAKVRGNQELQVKGYRFSCDHLSPRAKLVAAQKLVTRDRMTVRELPCRTPFRHSVMTGETKDASAIDEVVEFLAERLLAPA